MIIFSRERASQRALTPIVPWTLNFSGKKAAQLRPTRTAA
jgi:hypothetical protein